MADDGELVRLRASMDVLNQRLAAILVERARLVREIGAWKRANGVPAVDEAREAAMLANVVRDAPADGFPTADLRTIWAAVFGASRRLAERSQ